MFGEVYLVLSIWIYLFIQTNYSIAQFSINHPLFYHCALIIQTLFQILVMSIAINEAYYKHNKGKLYVTDREKGIKQTHRVLYG